MRYIRGDQIVRATKNCKASDSAINEICAGATDYNASIHENTILYRIFEAGEIIGAFVFRSDDSSIRLIVFVDLDIVLTQMSFQGFLPRFAWYLGSLCIDFWLFLCTHTHFI